MVFWGTDLADGLRQADCLGFDAIELWTSHLEKESHLSAEGLARLLREAGLACTIHAPIRDINIASANRGIRRESTSQMIDSVDLCASLGGELVVVHPGKLSSRHSDPEQHWSYQVVAYREILAAASDRGVVVTTENMEWEKKDELVRTPQEIRRLQASVSEYRLPVTLDLTHLGETGRVLEAIDMLADDIVHVHVSDCGPPLHIPLGQGTLDLKTILHELRRGGFSGILSFEIFMPPGTSSSLEKEKAKLVELIAQT